jgi:hypothetical protein
MMISGFAKNAVLLFMTYFLHGNVSNGVVNLIKAGKKTA